LDVSLQKIRRGNEAVFPVAKRRNVEYQQFVANL